MSDQPVPIFDGHNDVLLRLYKAGDLEGAGFFRRNNDGHMDLPRARDSAMFGGFFAIFVPSPGDSKSRSRNGEAELSQSEAAGPAMAMAGILARIERRSGGQAQIVREVAEIERCRAEGRLAMIMHMEGIEAIDPELAALETFYQAGLRSLGPVWSRDNAFGCGTPFAFPGSPDSGAGLTEAGKGLVRACNEMGILIDLSHLNEKGFWDVAKQSKAPLVATHSNAHTLTPAPRNLTDAQLDAISASGGIVGLNYATGFLREDGKMNADTALSTMLAHLDHLLSRLGEGGVGLGSDFDGAVIPNEIGDVAGNQRLVDAMRTHGYGEALIERICWRNWMDILRRTWRDTH